MSHGNDLWDDRLENEYVIVFPNGLEVDERLRYCNAECVIEDSP